MQYYKFNRGLDLMKIGEFPQCRPAKTINPDNPDSYRNVYFDRFPSFVPSVELTLNPKAKLTDMLSAVGPNHGYIVNKKIKDILEKFRLPQSAFYPIIVYQKKERKQYYWFHAINNEFWEWVDKEQSSLLLRSILPDERHTVLSIANLHLSKEELTSLARSKPSLTAYYWEKLVLKNNFPNLDYFMTLFPSRPTLISQRLLNALQEAGITGYEINEFCEVKLSMDV